MLSFRSALVILLVVSGGLLGACAPAAAQDPVRETRTVESFTEIGFSVPGTVYLRQGEPRSVEVVGPEEVLAQLETVVEGETLHIRDEEGDMDWFDLFDDEDADVRVEVYVTAPTINGLSIAGSGDIVGETPITTGTLELQNAGAGGFDLEVDADELSLSIAGSGNTRLRGRGNALTVEIAGSGNVEASDLEAATVDVSIAGSGDVRVHATDRISAEIMGSGDVQYRGDPEVDSSILGSGAVRPLKSEP